MTSASDLSVTRDIILKFISCFHFQFRYSPSAKATGVEYFLAGILSSVNILHVLLGPIGALYCIPKYHPCNPCANIYRCYIVRHFYCDIVNHSSSILFKTWCSFLIDVEDDFFVLEAYITSAWRMGLPLTFLNKSFRVLITKFKCPLVSYRVSSRYQ